MSGGGYVPLVFAGTGLCSGRDGLAAEANDVLARLHGLLADALGCARGGLEGELAEGDAEQFAVWLEDNAARARGLGPDFAGREADRLCDRMREGL